MMGWFRVDDSFSDHPKVESMIAGTCSDAAIALWTLAGAWSAKHLTDGLIPFGKVARLGVKKHAAAAAELCRVRLWVRTDDGFQFHQWHERQPARSDVVDAREADRVRKAAARAVAKGAAVRAVSGRTDAGHPAGQTPDSAGTSEACPGGVPARAPASPSHPIPSSKAEERRLGIASLDGEASRLVARLMIAHDDLAPGVGSIAGPGRAEVGRLLEGHARTLRAEIDDGTAIDALGDELVAKFIEAFRDDPGSRADGWPPGHLVTSARGAEMSRAADLVRHAHGRPVSKAWKGPQPPMRHVLGNGADPFGAPGPEAPDDGRPVEERKREAAARKADVGRYAKGVT